MLGAGVGIRRFCCDPPFLDGNGRTCRILPNAITMRYAGIFISIGEHEEERLKEIDIRRVPILSLAVFTLGGLISRRFGDVALRQPFCLMFWPIRAPFVQ